MVICSDEHKYTANFEAAAAGFDSSCPKLQHKAKAIDTGRCR